jgi:hypothetical protein
MFIKREFLYSYECIDDITLFLTYCLVKKKKSIIRIS